MQMDDSAQAVKRVLIVKTSSLGDIIQSLGALEYLHEKFPEAKIDWVAEEGARTLLENHPLIHRMIACNTKKWKEGSLSGAALFIRNLRMYTYDVLFDLQGNTKSGLWTFLAKAKKKVGFASCSVREWPNLLATRSRFSIPQGMNIRLQHIELVKRYFGDKAPFLPKGIKLRISEEERQKIEKILRHPVLQGRQKVMVCPGSKWKNKRLNPQAWKEFLSHLSLHFPFSFLFLWGNSQEKELCEDLLYAVSGKGILVDILPLSTWQNLCSEVDLVLAVDSSALHLAAAAGASTFSFFGPTSPDVFKPSGKKHHMVQGRCPYQKNFSKQCPLLRTCKTGACTQDLSGKELFSAFSKWWENKPSHDLLF